MSTEIELPQASPLDELAELVAEDAEERLTWTRKSIPRAALSKGLAQYLGPLEIDWNGRTLRFVEVLETWAEPETIGKFPSLAIISPVPADYESNVMASQFREIEVAGQRRLLRISAEVTQDFAITLWTTDTDERNGLAAAIEDALEPSETHSGLRLRLPFYHNVHAEYEKLSVFYDDDARGAQSRRRRAIFVVQGRCPQFVQVGARPRLRPKACVIITDPQDPPDANPTDSI